MTSVLPELRGLPSGLVLDGELVAWKGSEPYFPLVCRRVLKRTSRKVFLNCGHMANSAGRSGRNGSIDVGPK